METILVSPRKICECGKSVLKFSAKERQAYDDIVRQIEDRSNIAKTPDGEISDNVNGIIPS